MSIIDYNTATEQDIINTLRRLYHKTAIGKGNGTTQPTRLFLELLDRNPDIKKTIRRVFDYGCGKGRDQKILSKRFIYTGYDPHADFGYETDKCLLDRNYDLVVCNYVLNVIVKIDRDSVIQDMIKFLKRNILVLVGVRTDNYNIQPYWTEFQDGYITTRYTFQHFFNSTEIKTIFSKYADVKILDSRGAYLLTPKINRKNTMDNFIKRD